jgi:hypothetical protein
MGFMLYALITLLLILLILFALIIFVPIAYSVEGVKEDQYFFTIRISWLWKIINNWGQVLNHKF